MNLSAHYKQIAQLEGVLSAESGAHEHQVAGAIRTGPTAPNCSDSQVRTRNILHFLPVARYFFGQNFSRADLAGAREWNMKRNDVI